jgi:hypothetical protein
VRCAKSFFTQLNGLLLKVPLPRRCKRVLAKKGTIICLSLAVKNQISIGETFFIGANPLHCPIGFPARNHDECAAALVGYRGRWR